LHGEAPWRRSQSHYALLLPTTCATKWFTSNRTFAILRPDFLVRFVQRVFGLTPSIFKLTLYLLSNASDSKSSIACQLACLFLQGSHRFVNSAFHSIFIQKVHLRGFN
jgi:hypothetical protein